MSIYRDQPRSNAHVLICSGLDPSGGAGFLADARIVVAAGVRPVGIVTALTVQNTMAVRQVHPVDPEVIGAQLAALLGDIEVQAVKLGLIGSVQGAREIGYGLDLTAAPVVWDPVGAPSRGSVDFDAPAFAELLSILAPHLRLITPNTDELALLAGRDIADRSTALGAARVLVERLDGVAVLVKGGHLDRGDEVIDTLVTQDRTEDFVGPRHGGDDVHGTGCALSSAIAAQLALGADLVEACRSAKELVASHIATAGRPGRGAPAIV